MVDREPDHWDKLAEQLGAKPDESDEAKPTSAEGPQTAEEQQAKPSDTVADSGATEAEEIGASQVSSTEPATLPRGFSISGSGRSLWVIGPPRKSGPVGWAAAGYKKPRPVADWDKLAIELGIAPPDSQDKKESPPQPESAFEEKPVSESTGQEQQALESKPSGEDIANLLEPVALSTVEEFHQQLPEQLGQVEQNIVAPEPADDFTCEESTKPLETGGEDISDAVVCESTLPVVGGEEPGEAFTAESRDTSVQVESLAQASTIDPMTDELMPSESGLATREGGMAEQAQVSVGKRAKWEPESEESLTKERPRKTRKKSRPSEEAVGKSSAKEKEKEEKVKHPIPAKAIPSWEEVVGIVIEANMEARARAGQVQRRKGLR